MSDSDKINFALAVFTFIGLIVTWIVGSRQVQEARKAVLGEFLVRIDEMMHEHRSVHLALRPGGKWSQGDAPESPADWANVEAYMGLFERIYYFFQRGLVDKEAVVHFYRYRVVNIVANDTIRQAKLVKEKGYWTDFLKLCELLDIKV
jgi:hypothetical protein